MRAKNVIQKNWQELIKPNKPEIKAGRDPQQVATIVVEPLERGFGVTPWQRIAQGFVVIAPGRGNQLRAD